MEELGAEIKTNTSHIGRVGDTVEENRKEMKAVKAEIQQITQGRVNKHKLEITLKHKQELVEQLSQPTNVSFHEDRMADLKMKKREASLELVTLMASLAETQAKATLQAMDREMLYLSQFHLGQVYSENSSKLASLCQELGEQEALLGPEEARYAHVSVPFEVKIGT